MDPAGQHDLSVRYYVCPTYRFSFALFVHFEKDRREPESAVRLFGVDLLAGLQQAHASGFVHGNLRPANVLVDEYGILKLSGFGLARSVTSNGDDRDASGSAESGALVAAGVGRLEKGWEGDPAYMAPELFAEGAEALSFASDFWSLGCILFELFTGEPPFGKSSLPTVAERVQREVSLWSPTFPSSRSALCNVMACRAGLVVVLTQSRRLTQATRVLLGDRLVFCNVKHGLGQIPLQIFTWVCDLNSLTSGSSVSFGVRSGLLEWVNEGKRARASRQGRHEAPTVAFISVPTSDPLFDEVSSFVAAAISDNIGI